MYKELFSSTPDPSSQEEGIPAVGTVEDGGWSCFCGLGLGELAAPRYALLCLSALAAVVVLKIAGSMLALLLPVVPTLRTNVSTHLAVH